jgi:hypothetical protein
MIIFVIHILLLFVGYGNPRGMEANKHLEGPMRIAILLTGQLARLELHSKLVNVLLPNLDAGHTVHLFISLDSDVDNVRQTQHYSSYRNTPFRNSTKRSLRTHIKKQILQLTGSGKMKRFRCFVSLKKYVNTHTAINGPSRMDKMWTGNWSSDLYRVTPEFRFNVNMRMFSVMRDGVRHIQETEVYLGRFYNLVVRIREDSFFYGSWLLDSTYLKSYSSLSVNSWHGVNDHDFAIDRRYVDRVIRGLIEDYFIDFENIGIHMKHSTEIYIMDVLKLFRVEIRGLTVCELPAVPLRGINGTQWQMHKKYIANIVEEVKTYDSPCWKPEWYDRIMGNNSLVPML